MFVCACEATRWQTKLCNVTMAHGRYVTVWCFGSYALSMPQTPHFPLSAIRNVVVECGECLQQEIRAHLVMRHRKTVVKMFKWTYCYRHWTSSSTELVADTKTGPVRRVHPVGGRHISFCHTMCMRYLFYRVPFMTMITPCERMITEWNVLYHLIEMHEITQMKSNTFLVKHRPNSHRK